MSAVVMLLPAGDPALAPTAPLVDGLCAADAAVQVTIVEPPGPRPGRGNLFSRPASLLASRAAAKALPGLVTLHGARVVVSDAPATIAAMGSLRAGGRLRVPAVALVTRSSDPASQAARGIDLHLLADPGFEDAVRAAVPGLRAIAVRGLLAPEYEADRERELARRAIGVPGESPLVVIHGGQRADGDLVGAGEVSLAAEPSSRVVILCGSNADRLAELQKVFTRAKRLRVVGPTDRMAELLAATDVLIDTAGGLTVAEARSRGAAVIAFGWGEANGRQALADELIEALRSPSPGTAGLAGLPTAGAEVLAAAGLLPAPV